MYVGWSLSIPILSQYQQGWVDTAFATVFQMGVDSSKSFKVIEPPADRWKYSVLIDKPLIPSRVTLYCMSSASKVGLTLLVPCWRNGRTSTYATRSRYHIVRIQLHLYSTYWYIQTSYYWHFETILERADPPRFGPRDEQCRYRVAAETMAFLI